MTSEISKFSSRSKMVKVPRGIQGEKARKRYSKFGKTCLNNWSISLSQKGDGTRCPEG